MAGHSLRWKDGIATEGTLSSEVAWVPCGPGFGGTIMLCLLEGATREGKTVGEEPLAEVSGRPASSVQGPEVGRWPRQQLDRRGEQVGEGRSDAVRCMTHAHGNLQGRWLQEARRRRVWETEVWPRGE